MACKQGSIASGLRDTKPQSCIPAETGFFKYQQAGELKDDVMHAARTQHAPSSCVPSLGEPIGQRAVGYLAESAAKRSRTQVGLLVDACSLA